MSSARLNLFAMAACAIATSAGAFLSSPAYVVGRNSVRVGSGAWRAPVATFARSHATRSLSLRMAAPATTEEFLGVDADGNPIKLTLPAKEKLYLDACSAFHNDGQKLIPDEEYEQLKADLAFEGSSVAMMSREEILFMVAASRWQEGKPIMPDSEFDSLRRKLKSKNSPAVLHKVSQSNTPTPHI
jgi:hypothetical protein